LRSEKQKNNLATLCQRNPPSKAHQERQFDKAREVQSQPVKPKRKRPAKAVGEESGEATRKGQRGCSDFRRIRRATMIFPRTFISGSMVSLDDPEITFVRLTWTGPKAAAQETGTFPLTPGAGTVGTTATLWRRKPAERVQLHAERRFRRSGFASRLSTDARCGDRHMFMRAAGSPSIFFPIVPRFAPRTAVCGWRPTTTRQLIHDNRAST